MSFGFSIGDFIAIIELANRVRKDFAGAPTQFQGLSAEVRDLSFVLQDVDAFISEHDIADREDLCKIAGSCQNVLEDVQRTLDKYRDLESTERSFGKRAKRAWKRLTWEPDDIRDLRGRITTSISLLNSFVQGYTRDNVVKLVKRQDNQEDHDILEWLTPVDYAAQQSDFFRRRQAGTGHWLLDSPEYQNWVATEQATLFCPGIPGAGKTILTSIVVDDLYDRFCASGASTAALCYVYCNFRRKDEQTLHDLMLSILKQLAQAQQSLHGDVRNLYNRHKARRTRPSIDEIANTLQSVATACSKVFIVVDALDECQSADGCRSRFISEILNFQSKTGVNIMATSRFIPEILTRFEDSVSLEIRASKNDIGRYLESNILHLPGFVSRNPDLQNEIKESIMETVHGMFLLAQLHLDSLRGKRSIKAVRTALTKLASGSDAYDSAYNDAIKRIQCQIPEQKDLALQVLSWITCARRPLTTTELQHAMAVEIGESVFDEDNLPDLHDLVSACCGLVTIDEDSGIIRLVHHTTQEYFQRTQGIWFPEAQLHITTICATYLLFDVFSDGLCTSDSALEERLKSHPLYDYACRHWGYHARHSSTCQEVLRFLKSQTQVDAASQVLLAMQRFLNDSGYSQRVPTQMTGPHLAAYHGLDKVMATMLPDCDLDENNSDAETPLTIAAERGHDLVVRLLLSQGAKVESRTKHGRTPLSLAAERGHQTVVQLLLEKGAEIESKDYYYRQTPLSWAAKGGQEGVVGMLLACNADTESKDLDGQTPLLCASWIGHETVVRLLLDQKADMESESGEGQTPLSYAAERGHENVVRLLLDHGADVTSKDRRGQTSFSYAVQRGHETVVQLLLDHNTEIDARDNDGWTPFSRAVRQRYKAVVQLLLDHGAKIKLKNIFKQTPVSRAFEKGHEAIVWRLLDHSVNGRARNGHNLDPLLWATERGDWEVLHFLLSQGVDTETKDDDGRTPLSCAAQLGHETIVRLLLDQGADIESRDSDGRTALSYAAEEGEAAVVNLLLDRGADVESRNSDGRTALSYAAEEGYGPVIRVLLKRGADVELKDTDSWSPLSWAAAKGHMEAVQMLLHHGVNMESSDTDGRTPLMLATIKGHGAVVRLLLDSGADIAAQDETSHTSLFFAVATGENEVFHVLLADGRITQTKDHYASTPLSMAACYGRAEMVKELLAIPGIDANTEDRFGRTPLWWAQRQGHTRVAAQLLEAIGKPGVDMTMTQMSARSPTTLFLTDTFCDVCLVNIEEGVVYYSCQICNNGNFDICVECRLAGAQCLVETHVLF